MATIGGRIRKVRKDARLSQEVFAASVEITQGFLSGLEKGRYQPTADLLIRIANIYKVDANWLLVGETPTTSEARAAPDPISEKVLLILQDMPEEKRREVLKYAEEKKLLVQLMAVKGREAKNKD